ncbi:MAG: MurR/RpiR family transcriptional regulator [Lachnospiraceae bacterium]|nr:MurR/RpiR family transcriptional regulator [Lachnospiraceae bacterium]
MTRITGMFERLSKSQKRIATFVTEEYEKAIYMTAARIAQEVKTSESTVVRFAERLGYDGYPAFQEALRLYVNGRTRGVLRSDATYGDASELEILHSVLSTDMDNLKDTRVHVDAAAFSQAVDKLMSARHVYILGVRSCAPLAQTLAYHMHLIRDDVILLNESRQGDILEQMLHISEKDTFVGISFPRYSIRTLKALEYANDRSAQTVAITDSVHSPMNLYSSCNLFARSHMVSIVDSLTAPMSLIYALIVSMCVRRPDTVRNNLKRLEDAFENYRVDRQDEMEYTGDRAVITDPLWHRRDDQPI